MVTKRGSERGWSTLLLPLLCSAAGVAVVTCGFSSEDPGKSGSPTTGSSSSGPTGAAGSSSSGSGPTPTTTGMPTSSSGSGSAGGGGSSTVDTGPGPVTTGGGAAGGPTTTSGGGSGGMPTSGAGGSMGGTTGSGGTGGSVPTTAPNYELHGNWPALKSVIATKPGKLTYQKVTVQTDFLAESCSIADYNKDGIPDISAGRRWYQGPDFTGAANEHIFRGGHGALPRAGAGPEIVSGVSDDWSDFPWDMDGDGLTDIINIASSDANTAVNPEPRPQQNATAVWYKNPGGSATVMWQSYPLHNDVRHEQHGFTDMDGDGKPEIYGACKGCPPGQTRGYYYQPNWNAPTGAWSYRPVTSMFTFPFGGTGWMHGLGTGDVNGDGKPDFFERSGVWLQQANGMWNATRCPGAGCGYVATNLWDGAMEGNRGGSHMFSFDVDGDGDADIVSADWAHGWNLAWYEQTTPLTFVKHQFMATNSAADIARYGIGFSQPHSMQVVDMDGDNVPDIVVGKMRFAHPLDQGDPDSQGAPLLYVLKTIRNKPSVAGSVTFEPHLVDMQVGTGRQLSVGHINTDGIVDICISSKLGLYVFYGQ